MPLLAVLPKGITEKNSQTFAQRLLNDQSQYLDYSGASLPLIIRVEQKIKHSKEQICCILA